MINIPAQEKQKSL